jgi:hypothetical protein
MKHSQPITYKCPRCGASNRIVNECGCDPGNLPTRPPLTESTLIDLTDMPPGIRVTLTAERNLPPETVKALCDMIQIAAKSFQRSESMKQTTWPGKRGRCTWQPCIEDCAPGFDVCELHLAQADALGAFEDPPAP